MNKKEVERAVFNFLQNHIEDGIRDSFKFEIDCYKATDRAKLLAELSRYKITFKKKVINNGK